MNEKEWTLSDKIVVPKGFSELEDWKGIFVGDVKEFIRRLK